ncbi:hypothetical protein [Cryobacterium sp. GrIS_2_6]|uniref:hypothetical protein n=1 Tax=Cryobacterium sp. GrIS_2_6 TaxID=3162785 RepID=UPI002DFE8DA3|nr:hypothetical protein [Cryobacterium psychrotolerans]MEC5149247.1 hypothetical protein [Cryobacterium psychrotolerans]MEC5149325.1 hypothetical protein [Cryobacterium psychrotolerans]
MRRLKWLFTAFVTRKYWIWDFESYPEAHRYPNRDKMQHEAIDCWCGPASSVHNDGDGDCWHVLHCSLDGREARERA